MIQLKAYVGQDWARGQMGTVIGIFPLNFVEVIEDLPPPSSQPNTLGAAKPAQVSEQIFRLQRAWRLCHSTRHTGPHICYCYYCSSSSITSLYSVGFSSWCGVGGGSVRLCWKFRRRPVLPAGRPHSGQPAYRFWVELWSTQWQRGHFPQGFC